MRTFFWSLALVLPLSGIVPSLVATGLAADEVPAAEPTPAVPTPAVPAPPKAGDAANKAVDTKVKDNSKVQPLSITVQLTTNAALAGTLTGVDAWSMKTSFGVTQIPLSAVAGIKLAQADNSTTTVVLHNGDTITGAIEIPEVNIETEWGKAEIRGTHISSILFTPGLKWTSEAGLSGTRWKLVSEQAVATTPAAAPRPAATPGVLPTGGTVPVGRPIFNR